MHAGENTGSESPVDKLPLAGKMAKPGPIRSTLLLMPLSWTAIFRMTVLLLMAAHVFYLYAFARMLQEIVGLDLAAVLASSSFALVMLTPLAPAMVLPDIPQMVRCQVGRRRWLQGRCAVCGHSLLAARGGTLLAPERRVRCESPPR